MVRVLILASSIFFGLTLPVAASDKSNTETNRSHEIFGQQLGRALIVGIDKACDHVRQELRSAQKETRVLLLSDQDATGFFREACDGICDFEETNRIVRDCRNEGKIQGCLIYGAIYQSQVFDLAIDAYGKKISEECGDG